MRELQFYPRVNITEVVSLPQVTADVHHGELLLRADLSGCSMSQRSLHPPSRQTEAQAGAQL